ncbi:MAG: hypothetical protein KDB21_10095, partial [Acidimicrobiales bacterium]|nr:hypothetical protein [Acidimicrobiales bacterium]
MAERVRRKANARLKGAKGHGVDAVVTATLNKLAGGTWVGGNVILTDDFLGFSANALNRIVQQGELDVQFPVRQLVGAEITGGFGSKIIAVDLADGSQFEFRCTKAREVLD